MSAPVLAAHLSVSESTVDNWFEQGLLPAPIRPSGIRLWYWPRVVTFLLGDTDEAGDAPSIAGLTERVRHAVASKRPQE
jgi:hypothetical protein